MMSDSVVIQFHTRSAVDLTLLEILKESNNVHVL